MRKVKLKYGCNHGGNFYSQGTEVEVVEDIASIPFDMEYKPNSNILCVKFPNTTSPSLVHVDQIIS